MNIRSVARMFPADFSMARTLTRTSAVQVWPAFTDAMLAFVLVLVLMLAYQVGRQIDIVGPDQEQVLRDKGEIAAAIEGLGEEDIKIEEQLGRQKITFGSEVLFESGSPDLKASGRDLIARLASAVAGQGVGTLVEIQVAGHTDDVPTQRQDYTNLELSAERATNVVRSLTASGIDPALVTLSATGYGEHDPVRSNGTEAGRRANRRIEALLIYDQADEPEPSERP